MTSTVLKNLLTAFSPRGDYLAVCAGDGRVKTWDAISGSIKGDFADLPPSTSGIDPVVDGGHLAVDYTCMAWNPAVKKGKKKHSSSFLLGLGTGSGDVVLLDVALGKLRWKVQDCHPGGVKSMAFAKSGAIIYSSGVDGMVCELEVDSGQLAGKFKAFKRAVSCITVSGDGKYLVAGSAELRLFQLSSKKRVGKFTGHPDAVKALIYTDNDDHLLSSAAEERRVAVWQHNVDEGNTKTSAGAVCSLSMEHPTVSLDCSGELPGSLRVLAITEAGIAYVWHGTNIGELATAKPIKVAVAHAKGDVGKSGRIPKSCVLAAKIVGKGEKGPGSVLVAFGTTVKPVFEHLSLEGKGDSILLQANDSGTLIPHSQANNSAEMKGLAEAVIVGPDNAVDADKPRAHVELEEAPSKPPKRKKRESMEGEERAMNGPKSDGNEGNVVGGVSQHGLDEGEETMEEKLRAMGILDDGGNEGEEKPGSLAPLKADSLQVLMTQALESDDKSLLKQCLSVTDEKVIVKTVRLISSSNAAKFLQMAVFQIDSRTKRALVLVPWMKAILLYHASYIMSNPSMQPILSSLYQVIDSRLMVFRSLLSLSGRLELITAQVSSTATAAPQEEVPAAVVYEESSGDEDGGEVEDVMDADDEDMEEEDASSDESDEELSKENGERPRSGGGSLDAVMEGSEDDDDDDDL